MLTKEETNANMVWFLMIFGTLGSFIVLCVAGVGVVECIISVKNCRHSSQHEPGMFDLLMAVLCCFYRVGQI